MKAQRAVVLVLVLLAGSFLGWRALAPQVQATDGLSGYIEGEALYLAAPVAGTVVEVAVRRGERVAAGQHLFAIDAAERKAQRDRAAAALAAAEAQAADARQGQRPAELAVLDGEVGAAEARVREARAELERVAPLVRKGIHPPAQLDESRGGYETAAAEMRAAQRRREAADLGAREAQVEAADARVREAKAALAEADARLADLSPVAPHPGRVEQVFFQPGEWVGASQPVVALVPDDRVFIRFFVPETAVAAYRPGATVAFACDGCPAGLVAEIVYVSPRPEFTPPVLYSRESRDRLVFMVEARPRAPGMLMPGLPVDVVPIGGGRRS